MGIDYTTYMGPYARCKTSKVPATEKISTCSNEQCKEHPTKIWDKKKKFCEGCGSPIQERDIPIQVDNVNAYELRMSIKESLYDVPGDSWRFWMRENNTHVWLANQRVSGARGFSFDPEGNIQFIPVTPELMAAEIKLFIEHYTKELDVLRQAYGEDNVEIQWGLIHYIS